MYIFALLVTDDKMHFGAEKGVKYDFKSLESKKYTNYCWLVNVVRQQLFIVIVVAGCFGLRLTTCIKQTWWWDSTKLWLWGWGCMVKMIWLFDWIAETGQPVWRTVYFLISGRVTVRELMPANSSFVLLQHTILKLAAVYCVWQKSGLLRILQFSCQLLRVSKKRNFTYICGHPYFFTHTGQQSYKYIFNLQCFKVISMPVLPSSDFSMLKK